MEDLTLITSNNRQYLKTKAMLSNDGVAAFTDIPSNIELLLYICYITLR